MKTDQTDSRWAWVVLCACASCSMLTSGLAILAGIYQKEFLEHFDGGVVLTSWITSLFASLMQLAGPLAGLVSSAVSCRASVMAGAVFLTAGLVMAAFCQNVHLLLLTFGISSGLGLGLIYSSAVVAVNLAFVRYRSLATGLVFGAGGIGIIGMPELCKYLLKEYSWQESLLMLAYATAQLLVAGALLFPPNARAAGNRRKKTGASRFCFCRKDKQKERDLEKEMHPLTVTDQTDGLVQHTTSGSKSNMDRASEKDETTKFIERSANVQKTEEHEHSKEELTHSTLSRYVKSFTNPSLMLICLYMFLSNAGLGAFLVHYGMFCLEKGSDFDTVTLAFSVSGATLTFGRVLAGILGQDRTVDPLMVIVSLVLISTVLFLLIPVIAINPAFQVTVLALEALYGAAGYSLLTVVTIHCTGVDTLSVAFGLEMISAGLGFLVAPPIAGWLVDITGSYDNAMISAGFFKLMAAFAAMAVCLTRPKWLPKTDDSETNKEIVAEMSA